MQCFLHEQTNFVNLHYVQGDPREPDVFWMGSTQ